MYEKLRKKLKNAGNSLLVMASLLSSFLGLSGYARASSTLKKTPAVELKIYEPRKDILRFPSGKAAEAMREATKVEALRQALLLLSQEEFSKLAGYLGVRPETLRNWIDGSYKNGELEDLLFQPSSPDAKKIPARVIFCISYAPRKLATDEKTGALLAPPYELIVKNMDPRGVVGAYRMLAEALKRYSLQIPPKSTVSEVRLEARYGGPLKKKLL